VVDDDDDDADLRLLIVGLVEVGKEEEMPLFLRAVKFGRMGLF